MATLTQHFHNDTNIVKARTPALGYVGLRTVIEWIWLQTWTRVIIGVDVW
jgi:hypothetical protein